MKKIQRSLFFAPLFLLVSLPKVSSQEDLSFGFKYMSGYNKIGYKETTILPTNTVEVLTHNAHGWGWGLNSFVLTKLSEDMGIEADLGYFQNNIYQWGVSLKMKNLRLGSYFRYYPADLFYVCAGFEFNVFMNAAIRYNGLKTTINDFSDYFDIQKSEMNSLLPAIGFGYNIYVNDNLHFPIGLLGKFFGLGLPEGFTILEAGLHLGMIYTID
jgi:hypothetical protein